jgi:DNA transformation protein
MLGTRRAKTSALFPGIGPVTEKRLLAVGVEDLAALRKLGAVDGYRRLKFRFGKAVTLNALYGLEAVILGCHWLDLPPERKEALRKAAERMKKGPADAAGPAVRSR